MTVAQDSLDLLPLFPNETEATIRERWNGWANEGLTIEDVEDWVDTREGSQFFICTQGGVREAARQWDIFGTEYVAATFALYSWGEYLDDHGATYSIDRLAATPAAGEVTFFAPTGTVIAPGTVVGVEAAVEGAEVKEYEVTEGGTIGGSAEITVPVVAREAGSATDAAASQVTIVLSTVESSGEVTVANAAPLVGGTDPETDEALRERILGVFQGQGPGNVHDYEIWARSYGGVGRVTVIPVWSGPGTVKVIVLTADGDPVSAEVVEGLQAFLDPVAGKGEGQAPVGHTVTVETAEGLTVTSAAKIEFEPGYSLTGAGGTTAMQVILEEAMTEYINSVEPGSEIVRQKLVGRLTAFEGVHDVAAVKLQGKEENVLLKSNPAQVGIAGEIKLTEGAV